MLLAASTATDGKASEMRKAVILLFQSPDGSDSAIVSHGPTRYVTAMGRSMIDLSRPPIQRLVLDVVVVEQPADPREGQPVVVVEECLSDKWLAIVDSMDGHLTVAISLDQAEVRSFIYREPGTDHVLWRAGSKNRPARQALAIGSDGLAVLRAQGVLEWLP